MKYFFTYITMRFINVLLSVTLLNWVSYCYDDYGLDIIDGFFAITLLYLIYPEQSSMKSAHAWFLLWKTAEVKVSKIYGDYDELKNECCDLATENQQRRMTNDEFIDLIKKMNVCTCPGFCNRCAMVLALEMGQELKKSIEKKS